jgi:hypothetical protein
MTDLTTVLAEHATEPYRIRQRICAFYLAKAKGDGEFTSKELRVLCKERNAFNSPNFSRNLKQDTDFFEGSAKEGWSLTEEGKVTANGLFGTSAVSADCTCAGDPDEDEAAFDPECPTHASEPVALPTGMSPDDFIVVEPAPVADAPVADAPTLAPALAPVATFPTASLPSMPSVKVTPPKPAKVAAVKMSKRPPEMRGSQMLAALFRKIESND